MPVPTVPSDTPAPADTGDRRPAARACARCWSGRLALVSDELDRSLNAMLVEFEQQLFQLADHARNPGRRVGLHADAAHLAPQPRRPACRASCCRWRPSVAALRSPPAPLPAAGSGQSVSFHNLTLVEDAVMDEDTMLREIATRQEARASLALHLLGPALRRAGRRTGVRCRTHSARTAGPVPGDARWPARACRSTYDARLLLYRTFDRRVMANYAHCRRNAEHRAGRRRHPARPDLRAGAHPRSGRSAATAGRAGQPSRRTACAVQDKVCGRPKKIGAFRRRAAGPRRSEPAAYRRGWEQVDSGPDNVDEEAAFGMLQQLLTGRRELIGKLRPGGPQPAAACAQFARRRQRARCAAARAAVAERGADAA